MLPAVVNGFLIYDFDFKRFSIAASLFEFANSEFC